MRCIALRIARAAFFALFASAPVAAHAEFLRTSSSVYQGSDRRSKVIVSRSEPGIFIASGPELALQKFDPGLLRNSDTLHLFVRFDANTNRYSSVVVGGREYRVKNLSFDLGNMRITIDNQNPYLSIVLNGEAALERRPGILGFVGIAEVVNAVGDEAVAVLEANRFHRYETLVKPYGVARGGLTLDGEPVGGGTVGLEMNVPSNSCAAQGAVLVERPEIERAAAAPAAERDGILKKLMAPVNRKNPLDTWLTLRTTEESILAFDYERTAVKVVRMVKKPELSRAVCVVDTLPVKR